MQFPVPSSKSLLPQSQFWKSCPCGKSRGIKNIIVPRVRGKHVGIIMMSFNMFRKLFNLSRKKEKNGLYAYLIS